jgi:hypothetical protein
MVAIVVVGAFLLLPAYGYSTQAQGDVGVTIKVQMSKHGPTDTAPIYKIDFSSGAKAGYVEYVGSWWGNVMNPQQMEGGIEYPRLGVSITITGYGERPDGQSSGLDITDMGYGYAYTYGDTFTQTYELAANQGDSVLVLIRIYDAWGVFTQLSETYVVV